MSETPHTLINPAELGAASGFSHGVLAARGRDLYIAGQVGADGDLVAQFDAALRRVIAVVSQAGGAPEHVVSMTIYTTVLDDYRSKLAEVGAAYRRHFGRHFPAMALLGVTELVDPGAVVEVSAIAVVPW